MKHIGEISDPVERRREAALLASQIGVFEYEPKTDLAFWDDRVRELWGIPLGEMITYETVVGQVHKDDRDLHDAATAKAFDPAGDGHMDMTYRVIPRDGRPLRWIRAVANCLFIDGEAIRLTGTVQDITAEQKAIQKNENLINELEHRVKNTLATCMAVINLSRIGATDVDRYHNSLRDRLMAMAASQDLLHRADWEEVPLTDMLDRAVASFLPSEQTCVTYPQSTLMVPAKSVVTAGMALHELMTNAVKYGALSTPGGHIEVALTSTPSKTLLTWQETRSTPDPDAQEPSHSGMGSILLMQVLPAEIGGAADRSMEPTGLRYSISIPDDWTIVP